MKKEYIRTKYACYMANLSMSVVGNLSPLLFLTFRSLYGITFSMLGALILINFCTQLGVDLLFSFYSHKLNIEKAVKLTPVLTSIGMLIYALFPFFFPQAVYLGLVIGTVIFAASGGLVEVLISPVIAEMASEDADREVSKLHSVYAWGVVGVVIFSTLFLLVFGKENWQILALLWTIIPVISCVLFFTSKVPNLKTPHQASSVLSLIKGKEFLVCFFCIFLGGASECTMSQWSSSYLEQVFGISKVWGDVFGVALFAVMLGLGRSLYAKYGKNIYKVLMFGGIGATCCYLAATLSNSPLIGLTACALTGFCVAMLWPGSLLVASERFPASGVAVFALMAAGGDLGASIGPQLVGTVTDFAIKNEWVASIASSMQMSVDQLGMKIGLLCATVFPLMAAVLLIALYRNSQKRVHSN